MTFETDKYGWIFKYKIHHLLFWTLYHFTWWTAYEGGVLSVFNSLKDPIYLIKFLSLIIFQAGEVIATKIGALPPHKLSEWVGEALEG